MKQNVRLWTGYICFEHWLIGRLLCERCCAHSEFVEGKEIVGWLSGAEVKGHHFDRYVILTMQVFRSLGSPQFCRILHIS